ncbi:hypothetical protein EIP91_000261 [Steccherinum ochraceum]|uniref:Uncharacterized protein n=1 Tax=Steccherinum ochraceum TaxID=92696 RepID=A0A4R0RG43_9APHY|nr:hypothetical protein EIP91_000261 [Steccherinum ochraceum]
MVLGFHVVDCRSGLQVFRKESILYKNLTHGHVLPFLGISYDVFKGAIRMIVPWMKKGTLRGLVNNYLEPGFRKTLRHSQERRINSYTKCHSDLSTHTKKASSRQPTRGQHPRGRTWFCPFYRSRTGSDRGRKCVKLRVSPWRRRHSLISPELFALEDFGLDSRRQRFSGDVYAFLHVFTQINSPFPESQITKSHSASSEANALTDYCLRQKAPCPTPFGSSPRPVGHFHLRCGRQLRAVTSLLRSVVESPGKPILDAEFRLVIIQSAVEARLRDLLPGRHPNVKWLQMALERTEAFYQGRPTGAPTWVLAMGIDFSDVPLVSTTISDEDVYVARAGKDGSPRARPSNIKSSGRRSSYFSCSEIYVKIYEVLVAEPQTLQRIPAVHQPDLNALGARPLKGDYDLDSTPLLVVLACINQEMLNISWDRARMLFKGAEVIVE